MLQMEKNKRKRKKDSLRWEIDYYLIDYRLQQSDNRK